MIIIRNKTLEGIIQRVAISTVRANAKANLEQENRYIHTVGHVNKLVSKCSRLEEAARVLMGCWQYDGNVGLKEIEKAAYGRSGQEAPNGPKDDKGKPVEPTMVARITNKEH